MLNAKASPSECQLPECVYRAPDCSLPLAELHSLRLTFSLRLSCRCFSFQISDFFFFMERCLFSVLGILCLPQFFSARQSQVKTNVTPKATQLNPNKTTKFLTSSSVLIIYQNTSLSMLQNDDIYRNHTNNLEN